MSFEPFVRWLGWRKNGSFRLVFGYLFLLVSLFVDLIVTQFHKGLLIFIVLLLRFSKMTLEPQLYALLTYTFDGDEAIVAPKDDVKRFCESCCMFKDCDWQSQDCTTKFIEVIKSRTEIKYVDPRWMG